MTWTPERIATAEPERRIDADEAPSDDLPTISRAAYDDQGRMRPHDYPSLGGPAPEEGDDSAAPTITG